MRKNKIAARFAGVAARAGEIALSHGWGRLL